MPVKTAMNVCENCLFSTECKILNHDRCDNNYVPAPGSIFELVLDHGSAPVTTLERD